ncbi:Hypothetical predicted protein [Cloeon dipterum]|uniref:Uncharacterized protein n=1 Tax=Cloeon dipterum TaxID=197152 RepID=A0A8S1D331_9INSE|nr:Hypothetical predicted protein [Cloeon dipterum]
MTSAEKDPQIADWINLLDERKTFYKMESKSNLALIDLPRVRDNFTKNDFAFFNGRTNYDALAEKALTLQKELTILQSVLKEGNAFIRSKYSYLNEKAKARIDKIVNE